MKKRFGVLRILATVLKILGIVVAAFAVLAGLGTLFMSFASGDLFPALGIDMNSGFFAGLISSFIIVIIGIFYAVFFYGSGELLVLLLSMEDNTFKTVKLLEDVIKDDQE